MYLRNAVKYRIMDFRSAIAVYYLVITALVVLLSITMGKMADGSSVYVSVSGTETAAIIFLFVLGLNSFREPFRMMMQNGISRKTMFNGFIITALILSAGMSVINEIFLLIVRFLTGFYNVSYTSLFEQIYFSDSGSWGNYNTMQSAVVEILFLTFLSAAAMMFGYFITSLYYRLNKSGKIAVSIGVPAMLIIVIPVFDALVTGGLIYRASRYLLLFAFGIKDGYNPYYAMVSCFGAFTLLAVLSRALTKRAPIK